MKWEEYNVPMVFYTFKFFKWSLTIKIIHRTELCVNFAEIFCPYLECSVQVMQAVRNLTIFNNFFKAIFCKALDNIRQAENERQEGIVFPVVWIGISLPCSVLDKNFPGLPCWLFKLNKFWQHFTFLSIPNVKLIYSNFIVSLMCGVVEVFSESQIFGLKKSHQGN